MSLKRFFAADTALVGTNRTDPGLYQDPVTGVVSLIRADGIQVELQAGAIIIGQKTGDAAGTGAVGTVTGGTVEAKIDAVRIPGGMIATGGLVEVATLWGITNNGNNKIPRVRFGTASNLNGTVYMGPTLTTVASAQWLTSIRNRGPASQLGFNPTTTTILGTTTVAPSTSSVDTTTDSYVVFSGLLANAGDSITLESYSVKVLPAPV